MKSSICALLLLGALASCNNKPTPVLDSPTAGKVRISIDENVQPLADELIDAFESSYPDAFLVQSYQPENLVAQELLNDSSRLALMTRRLNAEELKWFEAQKYGIDHIRLGRDAVMFLVNHSNPDSMLTVDELRRIISGEDTLWSQLRPGSTLGRINVVFDNRTSSNLSYLSDTLLGGKAPGKNCFAVTSNDSVVHFVNSNPNTIGIVGANWLGSKSGEEDIARRSKVSIARIGRDTTAYYYPDQSALVTGDYPFARNLWLIKIGKRVSLGTGFATFCMSERGQLIVQRAGLAPASPAQRRIHMNVE
jgi:phosphate transport system substrate-binding protein